MSNISEQDIFKALAEIKHPVIDYNLVELGIIRAIAIENRIAVIALAFPFTGTAAEDIPIRNEILNEVKKSIEHLGLKFQLKQTEMTTEELKIFLALEKKKWKEIT